MGYTVELGATRRHYETKAEALEEVKRLCKTDKLLPAHVSLDGIERHSDPLGNVVSLIPDPPMDE